MDIDLDMTVLGLSEEVQESLRNRLVYMKCPNGHEVPVRLKQKAGSSTIYCPECSKMIEPHLP